MILENLVINLNFELTREGSYNKFCGIKRSEHIEFVIN